MQLLTTPVSAPLPWLALHKGQTEDSEPEPYTIPFERNRYCGPAALAYVMRSGPDAAAAELRKTGGKRAICGVSNYLLLRTLDRLGFNHKSIMPELAKSIRTGKTVHPVLDTWLAIRDRPEREHIVCITRHYIVVHGDQYFDSRCHLGKPLTRCPYLRRRVRAAWEVTR